MDHTNHVRLNTSELTPAVLEGATIYGADDYKVGKIDHIHGSAPVALRSSMSEAFLVLAPSPLRFPFRISSSCAMRMATCMP